MISNSKNGWCEFKLGNFIGHPSYLTNVPLDLLNAFIEYNNKGYSSVWFNEEGAEFTLVLNPYSIFIIEEKENPILYDFSEFNLIDLEQELINDIENNLNSWCEFIYMDDIEEVKCNRDEIRNKLSMLKKYTN